MIDPEKHKSLVIGQEIVSEIGRITMDLFLRSGLPGTVSYSEVELVIRPTNDSEYGLVISVSEKNTYQLSFDERRRSNSDPCTEVFEMLKYIHIKVNGDGGELSYVNPPPDISELFNDAIELSRVLPTFVGAEGSIHIEVPTE